ncbi:MAG: hypothetical protein KDA78_12265 [Planctomycetaceae bacterium]|nr:hypothetical protein [Planctomycetaceae bacterium]
MISFSRFFNRILCGLLVLVGLLFVQVGQIRAENCAECGGYWVVSTYSLPQQPGCCPQTFPFSCYYKPVKGSLRPSSVSEMSQSLNPSAPTALFVHGSFVNIDKALNEARFTYSWLQQSKPCEALNVIFLAWPSDDVDTLLPSLSVIHNGHLADHNGIYLAHLIDSLPASSPLCLIGHSHGARVITACMHYRGGGRVQGCVRPDCCGCQREIRAILAAAAVNHEVFNPGQQFDRALSQLNAMLLLVNRKDLALTVYPLVGPSYGRAISKTGTTIVDRRQLGPRLCKIYQLDLTFDIGFRHAWQMYYTNVELARQISSFIHPRHSHHQFPCEEVLTTTPPDGLQEDEGQPQIPLELPAAPVNASPGTAPVQIAPPAVTAFFPPGP